MASERISVPTAKWLGRAKTGAPRLAYCSAQAELELALAVLIFILIAEGKLPWRRAQPGRVI
ncbi:hypothetical protein EB233_03990 [Mesorhizobium erdmanii]|uniref:Uncharacterized protein n=2 Tax=Mesorhizobium erdmanii TaxID=1777866 RepID=A0A6M7UDM5_9HYPH|nr:hypothetical protein A8146_06705 [Mesorhizobium loti]QKC74806.1 hypothetical protein EB233_03990 [Mesorhizobium erdmanii]